MPHPLARADVDLSALADELSTRLGRPVALSAVPPGQVDAFGDPLPGALLVVDPVTGEELKVDGRTVAGAVRSHVPPPSAEQRRADALASAEAKAAAGDTAGALADVLAMMKNGG